MKNLIQLSLVACATFGVIACGGNTNLGGDENNSSSSLSVCSDLRDGEYFAFESWNTTIPAQTKQHKTLYLKTDSNGNEYLNLKTVDAYPVAWSSDDSHSSESSVYLSRVEHLILDINTLATTNAHDLPFPAKLESCNGDYAQFSIGSYRYKLHVTSVDISGQNGASLQQGSTVSSILSPITFDTGDKMFKVELIAANRYYIVDKSNSSGANSNSYLIKDSSFASISNSTTVDNIANSVGYKFNVNFTDSSNRVELEILTAPTNNIGTVKVTKLPSNVSATHQYELQTYNGHKILVVKDFYGNGRNLFIGNINTIDSSSLIYGSQIESGFTNYITEGGSMNGDIMDDIMLNRSARDRVLSNLGLTAPSFP